MDANGALISYGAEIPGFIGVLDKSLQAILAHETAPIVDGDVFVLKDPNFGGVTQSQRCRDGRAGVTRRRARRFDRLDCALGRYWRARGEVDARGCGRDLC